jgi:hypothetical protein
MKHIMLMFLSDIKTYKTRDGQIKISEAQYNDLDDGFGKTESTNESAIRYLLQEGWNGEPVDHLDRLFVFASEKVRGKLVGEDKNGNYYRDEEQMPYTHLEFFTRSLTTRGILKNIDVCLNKDTTYEYDENATTAKTMFMVTEMAAMIQQYISAQHEKVILHVDLSGGMRHASMMILELMRLMEYNQVTIGHVLYSNFDNNTKQGKVEEVIDIYQFFNLISGAEEFVRFGSVSAIRDYYKDQDKLAQSDELEQLLKAMEGFAEEIKLCHRGNFEKAIRNLNGAITSFQNSSKALSGDKLMEQMIQRITMEYSGLNGADSNELNNIQWCLDHDYLQQALTLYIETIPLYLFDRGYVECTEEGWRDVGKKFKDDVRDKRFIALNEYDFVEEVEDPDWKDQFKTGLGKIIQDIDNRTRKDVVQELQKLVKYNVQPKLDDKSDINRVKRAYYNMFKEIAQQMFKKIKSADKAIEEFNGFIKKYPSFQYANPWNLFIGIKNLESLIHTPKKFMATKNGWIQELCSVETLKDKPWDTASVFAQAKWLSNFIKDKMNSDELYHFFSDIDVRPSARACRLIDHHKLKIYIDKAVFCHIIDQYGMLKELRNSSNHARLDEKYIQAEALKEFMKDGLKELEDAVMLPNETDSKT